MPSTVRTFYWLAATQIVSVIGSRMTGVALGIWLFETTGQASPVLFVALFVMLPQAVVGSFAGVMVDRWPRRQVLLWSVVGQMACTLLLLLSFLSGAFQIWHLYAVTLVQGSIEMFQRPAMDASVTMLVPDNHRDQANGVRQMTGPIAGVIAPVLTGMLYIVLGVVGVMVIDAITFTGALVVLRRRSDSATPRRRPKTPPP